MSRGAKFDMYLDQLEDVGDFISVPAESMPQLSYIVHVYQKTKHRNTKGLYLSCKKILNREQMTYDFIVRVDDVGRWDEAKKETD